MRQTGVRGILVFLVLALAAGCQGAEPLDGEPDPGDAPAGDLDDVPGEDPGPGDLGGGERDAPDAADSGIPPGPCDFDRDCDDGNPCTDDRCGTDRACLHTPNGAWCDDGSECTWGDRCGDGRCDGTAFLCDDADACTADGCDPATGCTHVALAEGAPCDDGFACTTGEACLSGRCTGILATCDDGNPCTLDRCDGPTQACVHQDRTGPCDDGNACTTGDACQAGTCVPGTALSCDDGNPCTSDACDPASGCRHEPGSGPCSDGSACTAGESCLDGACQGGAWVGCDDGNPCTDDACDHVTGCAHVDNTAPCEDGNPCTAGDRCTGGSCRTGSSATCNDGNPCTDDTCDPATGCRHVNNTASCDDGNRCLGPDQCKDGACASGIFPVLCLDLDPCLREHCDPSTGACVGDPTDFACDDGSRCTENDRCQGGACVGLTRSCDDGNTCTFDSCDAGTGCRHQPLKDGIACTDGNACTTGDHCASGACVGAGKSCDDGNPCTVDTCQLLTQACVHTAVVGWPCDDGDPCTYGDTCGTKACEGKPRYCDDGNACTTDSCSAALDGACVHANADGLPCDDHDVCTTGDACQSGWCRGGMHVFCLLEAKPCTGAAICDRVLGCVQPPVEGPCDDGDPCTVADGCEAGSCAGTAKDCDDHEPCTDDFCDPKTGYCAHKPRLSGACTDDNPCTTGGQCVSGRCHGQLISCDDHDPCTNDVCDPKGLPACRHVPIAAGGTCDDLDPCTTGDLCVGGTCQGAPMSCDDGNPCTVDTCDAAKAACVHRPKDCVDDDPCTTDSCDPGAGTCVHRARTCPGDPCNPGTCDSATGQCRTTPVVCSPGSDPCRPVGCDEATGTCKAQWTSGNQCDDHDGCTVNDTCVDGSCRGDAKCDDGNPCTTDGCNFSNFQCTYEARAGGACVPPASASCFEGECRNGQCQDVKDRCDDGDPCTRDTCTDWGCEFAEIAPCTPCAGSQDCPDGQACRDGACSAKALLTQPCETDDQCEVGVCAPRLDGKRCGLPPDHLCAYDDECASGTCFTEWVDMLGTPVRFCTCSPSVPCPEDPDASYEQYYCHPFAGSPQGLCMKRPWIHARCASYLSLGPPIPAVSQVIDMDFHPVCAQGLSSGETLDCRYVSDFPIQDWRCALANQPYDAWCNYPEECASGVCDRVQVKCGCGSNSECQPREWCVGSRCVPCCSKVTECWPCPGCSCGTFETETCLPGCPT